MKRLLSKEEIKNILVLIKDSITYEIEPIFDAYCTDKLEKLVDGHNPRSLIVPRLLFPEIEGLGNLRYGNTYNTDNSEYAVRFMRDYFPRQEYKKISGFIFNCWTRGLIRSHWSKGMSINNKNIGWQISSICSQENHLIFTDVDKNIRTLSISAIYFYQDFLGAIDNYIKEFDSNDNNVNDLIDKFSKVYYKINTAEPEKYTKRKSFLQDSDFDFFK